MAGTYYPGSSGYFKWKTNDLYVMNITLDHAGIMVSVKSMQHNGFGTDLQIGSQLTGTCDLILDHDLIGAQHNFIAFADGSTGVLTISLDGSNDYISFNAKITGHGLVHTVEDVTKVNISFSSQGDWTAGV